MGKLIPAAKAVGRYLNEKVIARLRVILWLSALGWLSLLVWRSYYDLLAIVPVAALAVAGFLLAALIAGPPHIKDPERPAGRTFWWELAAPLRVVLGITVLPVIVLVLLPIFAVGEVLLWLAIGGRNLVRRAVGKSPDRTYREFAAAVPTPLARSSKTAYSLWRDLSLSVKSVCRMVALVLTVLALASTAAIPPLKARIIHGALDDLQAAMRYTPVIATRVYSADGRQICTFANEERVPVDLSRVPPVVQQAFIAAEDQYFWEHHGIDITAILRAMLANHRSGTASQGGSTLTQQVVKQVVLKDSTKSYERKIREIIVAVELERRMADAYGAKKAKEKILEVYLNHIFLGHGTYGIQAAAHGYFGKDVSQLTLSEAAILAGLPKAPSQDSPYAHLERARDRQNYVLGRMVEMGFITPEQKDTAAAAEIKTIANADPVTLTAAPYFCDHVRRELKRLYGNEAIFSKGLVVETTLDMKMQQYAQAAVRLGLLDLERRLGFTGPTGHDAKFTGPDSCADPRETADQVVEIGTFAVAQGARQACINGRLFPLDPTDLGRIAEWETKTGQKLAVGDFLPMRLETRTEGDGPAAKSVRYALPAKRTGGPGHPEALQAALVAVDQNTGFLRALVGGYDWTDSQFNTATQARRQTGSSVKPYVYLTALMHGATVTKRVNDHPVCYETASGTWCPSNYDDKYFGPVDLRTALAMSLNSVSVQLLAETGVDEVIRTMRRVGIVSPIDRVMPIAVGALDLSPLEHTLGFATIAAQGRELPRNPGADNAGVFLLKVTAANGEVLYEYKPEPRRQVIPAADAYALTYLMQGGAQAGTFMRVRELQRPVAGKTGTTNDFKDVWFMGFTADLTVGTWVGRMTPQPIADKATGGGTALPIWLAFMKAAHPKVPVRDFPVPSDISLMPDANGRLVPFQRDRMDQEQLLPAPSGGKPFALSE